MTLQAIEDQIKPGLRHAAVQRMYVDHFGRSMNDYEWSNLWNPHNGSERTASLEQGLEVIKADAAGSPQRRDEIRWFYPALLGRSADGGLDTWVATRFSLPDIAVQFQNLPEGRRYLIDQLQKPSSHAPERPARLRGNSA